MKAMILAAGRGERMRPLTDSCPKPLLKVHGKSLIEHHLAKLSQVGITDIVINHAWLGYKIEQTLADGHHLNVNIKYSREENGALETAGGITKALPLLGTAPFLLVNGDVYTDFDFSCLPTLSTGKLAHLFLVPNPEHNIEGDFLVENGLLVNKKSDTSLPSFTYSGIAIFHPKFFEDTPRNEVVKLGTMLKAAAEKKVISASVFSEKWTDVGTPQRLEELNQDKE